jgi:hypothetical protein
LIQLGAWKAILRLSFYPPGFSAVTGRRSGCVGGQVLIESFIEAICCGL